MAKGNKMFGKVKGAEVPAATVKSVTKAPVMGKTAKPNIGGGKFVHARPEGSAHAPGGVGIKPLPFAHSSSHN
jgi:hypothetical protein